jgi:small subunit ribosomal protein S17
MDKTEVKKQGRSLVGEVVSAKSEKTVIVSVTNMTRHPLYRKAVRKTKRYAVHNEIAGIAVGDNVKIMETKPISKTKHFMVTEKMIK